MPELPLKQRIRRRVPKRLWRALREARARLRLVRTRPAMAAPAEDDGRVLACLIGYNALGGYCIPRRSLHREAAQAIVRGRIWERRTLELIGAHAGAGDIVHAGTYFGDFLPALSASCRAAARVWAFEPGRENFRCAEITIRLNGLDNVELIRAGLGEAAAEAALVTRDAAGRPLGGASRVSDEAGGATGGGTGAVSEPIRLVALDAVVPPERPVSVIHLDVEGHERQALAGARATIARWRPVLIVETVPPTAWIEQHLAPLGYVRAGMVDDNTVFRAEGAPTFAPAEAGPAERS